MELKSDHKVVSHGIYCYCIVLGLTKLAAEIKVNEPLIITICNCDASELCCAVMLNYAVL